MKQRYYYYIEDKIHVPGKELSYIRRTINCDDQFDGELIMLAFPIQLMAHISSVLSNFNLRNDAEYFYSECREVVSVPEKHVNEKGEGKLTFQAYFHKFPESVTPFYEDVTVVVMLHPHSGGNSTNRDYNMIGYIHANHIEFASPDGQIHKGYYYNVLRMSERTVYGEAIYRRKRLFTSMFSILLDIVELNDIHFVYATMGRENQAINDALKMNSERTGKFYETFPMRNNTHINIVTGSSSVAKRLIDITDNTDALQAYYQRVSEVRQPYVFNHVHTPKHFFELIKRITGSSPGSRVWMLPDGNGNMLSAGFAINWGDYLHLKLQNPKGLFKVIDSMRITDKILYPILLVGEAANTRQLLKGMSYKYRKEHGVQVTILNGHDGDPYFDVKKSIVHDPFLYFVIYDRPETYAAMKQHSLDNKGNTRIFIETPML